MVQYTVFPGRGGTPLQPQQFYIQDYVLVSSPFKQTDWPPLASSRPLPTVQWFDPPNLLLTTLAPVNYIFRAPIFVKIPIPPKAGGEVEGTLNTLLTPNPAQPFVQSDWPKALDPKPPLKSEVYWGTFALYSPNPPQPFKQLDWPRPIDGKARAIGEAVGIMPLRRAFNQSLWENAVKAWPKVVGEVVGTLNPLLTPNPPQPFSLSDWARIQSVQKSKVDDPLNLLTSTLAPAVVTVSYVFRTPIFARLPDPWRKANVDDPFNLTIYLPTTVVTFTISLLDKFDWPLPARPLPKVGGEAIGTLSPLLTPNPPQPFNQDIWDSATPAKAKAGGEATGTLSPVLAPNPPQPFVQSAWDLAIRAFPKAGGEVTGTLSPILTPNPARPFAQRLWDSATPPKPKAYADPFAAISALYNPNPSKPFSQYQWDSATRAWPKAVGESGGGILALLAPNPANPFNQSDWTRIPATSKAKVDDLTNLVPLYTVVVPQNPFYYRDEDARSFAIARAQLPQKSDVYRGPNALLTPNPAQPFVQRLWENPTRLSPLKSIGDVLASPNPIIFPNPSRPFGQADWPSSARNGPSDRSFAGPLNLPLISPPPPVPAITAVGAAIGTYPKWRMLGTPSAFPIGPSTPINAYVTEDGTIFYVTESGAIYYVQES